MKKMIIAAAIVCVTAFVQAGSIQWGSVAMFNDSDAKVRNNATLYFYVVSDADAFNAIDDVWATYGDDVKSGGANAFNPGGKKSTSSTSKASVFTDANADTTYYGVLIATIGTGDDMKYYAEKASVTTGNDGNGTYSFGTGVLDTAATAKSAWASATIPVTPDPGSSGVPEPTSGLLLLMGGALLALRRKQK